MEKPDDDEARHDGRGRTHRGCNHAGFRPGDSGRELREEGSDDGAA